MPVPVLSLERPADYPPPLPWEVPSCEVTELSPKKTPYCVVIPVINEGEKFHKQLGRMKALGLPDRIDLIIADGGSQDGSTDPERMKKWGVRSLLVKRDSGKLSAQLRMGYAYALSEGYDGVITIDGNNKDSVESIDSLIQALEEGFDFIQASRFIPGGRAIRTPLTRLLAIRLLHAPVISLAARHRFTDTTNGFRAYSRKYLTHPDVQPFRTVFDTYELLAYLSVRASQLGLKVGERPAEREYPATGPTPTKIKGIGGMVLLLKILFKTLLGHYKP